MAETGKPLTCVPLGTRVLVRPAPVEEMIAGTNFFHADTTKQPPGWGTVLAVGAEVKELEVGDKVFFGKYGASNEVPDPEDVKKSLYVLREEAIDCRGTREEPLHHSRPS